MALQNSSRAGLEVVKMLEKNKEKRSGISLSGEFIKIIDKILKENPDFKNRAAVVRYAVRKYYEELKKIEKSIK